MLHQDVIGILAPLGELDRGATRGSEPAHQLGRQNLAGLVIIDRYDEALNLLQLEPIVVEKLELAGLLLLDIVAAGHSRSSVRDGNRRVPPRLKYRGQINLALHNDERLLIREVEPLGIVESAPASWALPKLF